MTDRERTIKDLSMFKEFYAFDTSELKLIEDAIELLKDQESLLGIHQTAENIIFISTGDAQQGEARGAVLGKIAMREWLQKELIHRGLMTDDIRAVFKDARSIYMVDLRET